VSVTGAALLTLVVLSLAGALPVLVLVGPRLVAFPLMPLAGGLLAAAAAVCTITLAGSLARWFAFLAVLATLAALAVCIRRPERARRLWRTLVGGLPPLTAAAALALLAAVAWTLRTLRVPTVGFDAQAIWILHARWLSQGHGFALTAIKNHFLVLSHPGYPPFVSATMAMAWRVSGTSTDRVAVVTVALLNACALFVAGWGIFQVVRQAVTGAGVSERRRRLVVAAGGVTGVLTVLVAGGVLGTFATNGYADPLWSLAAVGAVIFGLVLPLSASNLAVAAILVGVTGLTKVEGTAVAVLLAVVVSARLLTGGRAPRRVLSAAGAALAALLVWPVVTLVLDVPTDPSLLGSRQGSLISRAHRTASAMTPHLHVLGLAVLCGLVGLLALRALRGRLGLGNELWAWAALVSSLLVLGGAYVFGPGNVELWLATSANRTTIFLALLAWWMVAVWAVCGVCGVAMTMTDVSALAVSVTGRWTGARAESESAPATIGPENSHTA
jgi:hypothetical protein